MSLSEASLWDSSFSIIKSRAPEASMIQQPSVLLCKTHRGFFEASSRLHRGFQEPIVLLCKTHRGFFEASTRPHRDFQEPFVLLCKTDRGFFEDSSRLSRTICFIVQNPSRPVGVPLRGMLTLGATLYARLIPNAAAPFRTSLFTQSMHVGETRLHSWMTAVNECPWTSFLQASLH